MGPIYAEIGLVQVQFEAKLGSVKAKIRSFKQVLS